MTRFQLKLFLPLFITLAAYATECQATVVLPSLFSDNIVVQRELPIPVWGIAGAGEKVSVALSGDNASTTADVSGRWMVHLKPLEAGGPFTLSVSGSNTITLNNVLIGDVWLCSGQSNMQFAVGWHSDLYAQYISASTDPLLRCCIVQTNASFDPLTDLKSHWLETNPSTVGQFTAVGYFFARELRKALGIPIGIIDDAYGGTQGESWVSCEALSRDPDLKLLADKQIAAMKAQPTDFQNFLTGTKQWQTEHGAVDAGNAGVAAGWDQSGFDSSGWATTHAGTSLANLGMKGGGVVWFRKTIVFPPGSAKNFRIGLGWGPPMFDVYFNGVHFSDAQAAAPFYSHPPAYNISGSLIKEGQPNTIAIRMVALDNNWGLWVVPSDMGFPLDPSTLTDTSWQYKVEQAFPAITDQDRASIPSPPLSEMQNTATTLYNAMIAPLIPYGIKGTLWYQGESNSSRGAQYKTLLPLLIGDWRSKWGEGDFPFYIVQLANFGDTSTDPQQTDDQWAAVREGQLLTSENVKNTGLAVTIDLGETHNIHPVRKPEVGHRLALIALANIYGQKQVFSGPIYSGMSIEGSTIRLTFNHVEGGLVSFGNGPLTQFAIAGADKSFVWAYAKIDGNTVVVSSVKVANPVAVRYAWANNPQGCNLYNANGLPASPFRTDSW